MAFNKQTIEGLKENFPVRARTTMKVGGKAKFYYKATSIDQLIEVVSKAREEKVDHLIIGGGSNLIFSDQGFDGLVIENRISGIEVREGQIVAQSGVFSNSLVMTAAEYGWQGLEFLSGIPATVGGLIINNAGAYGREVANVVSSVLLYDEDGQKRNYQPDDLGFSYRGSNLKGKTHGKSFPVVLSGIFNVSKSSSDVILRKIDDYRKIRSKGNPAGFSSGCIFKNPKISQEDLPEEWQDKVKDGRISAGFLLDMVGAKGLRVGQAIVPQEHANYIINKKRAKASQIKDLNDKMKQLVGQKYGIELKNEVEFIGKFD